MRPRLTMCLKFQLTSTSTRATGASATAARPNESRVPAPPEPGRRQRVRLPPECRGALSRVAQELPANARAPVLGLREAPAAREGKAPAHDHPRQIGSKEPDCRTRTPG